MKTIKGTDPLIGRKFQNGGARGSLGTAQSDTVAGKVAVERNRIVKFAKTIVISLKLTT